MSRSSVLDPDASAWRMRALCGPDSDLWFRTDWVSRQQAAHACKRHCPVREACAEYVAGLVEAKLPPLEQVAAGVRYTAGGERREVPTKGIRCGRCPAGDSLPVYQPSTTRTPPRAVSAAVAARRRGRNLDLLRRLANGDSGSEIAAALKLSMQTVKSHLRTLYDDLGARDRANAVAIGYETGLLGNDD